MKTARLLTISIVGFILLLSLAIPALAAPDAPPVPSSFYGEIHFQSEDGGPSAGNFVDAYVPGITGYAARATITTDGGNLVYAINVPGDDLTTSGTLEGGLEGGTVTFKIGTRVVATGIWHGGTNVNLVIHPPKANAGGPYVSPVNTAVNFIATASDYGSDAITYQWDWDNDGTYDATGASQSHTWTTAGTYTVGLKVTDAQGGVGTTTDSVIVYSLEGLTGQTYKDAPIAITVNGVSSPYSSVVKYAGSLSAPTNAGTYAVVVEIYNGATLVNTITGNNLVIDKLAITVTAVTDSKTYDGANTSSGVPTITSGSLAGDDAVTWTQTFDNKHVGTGKTLTPAGTVSDDNGGNNYAVTFATNTTGAITVRAITVSAATDTKTYDGTNTSNKTPTITSGALAPGDSATWTQTFDNENVGTGKTLTPAGTVSDGNGGNNYAVTFATNTTGAITVRAITVSAATDTKAYDGTNTSNKTPTITSGALAPGDSATWTQTFDNENVGTGKTLTPAGTVSDGSGGNNYAVTFATNTTGAITVRAITVSAATDTKAYDGTNTSNKTPTITSGALAPGDSATWTQTFDNENVGTGKTLTPAGTVSDGNGGNNYAVTFATNTTGVILASHTITLVPGWNLVSFNLQPYLSVAPADVLASLGENYDLVYAWDATGGHSGAGNWMKYDRTAPYGNTLPSMAEIQGFWINITALTNQTLVVAGLEPTTTSIDLRTTASGWNLIGFPSSTDSTALSGEVDYPADPASLIYAYRASDTTDSWKLYDYNAPSYANDLAVLSPGYGYWVYVTTEHTWNVAY